MLPSPRLLVSAAASSVSSSSSYRGEERRERERFLAYGCSSNSVLSDTRTRRDGRRFSSQAWPRPPLSSLQT
jgi:hypothetical protein